MLRIVGNIIRLENNRVIDILLKDYGAQLFPFLINKLKSDENKKEVAWVLSNIAGGAPYHVCIIILFTFYNRLTH